MSAIKKYVLITGANGAIGQAMVQEFHDQGYAIIATDIQESAALPELIEHFISLDLGEICLEQEQLDKFRSTIRAITDGQQFQCLINNAAVQIVKPITQLSIADFQHSIQVNTLPAFALTKTLLNELSASRGSVINISSIHARLTKKEFIAYATSKSALSGLTRAMAVELGEYNIRVNGIEPAAIDTAMLREGFTTEDDVNALAAHHPAGQIGYAEEVAKLAALLADSSLSFATGSIFNLSGGIDSTLHDPGNYFKSGDQS